MLRLAPAGPKSARFRGAAMVAALGGAMVAVPISAQDATYRDHPFLIFDEEDSRTADVALADLDGDGDLDVAAANGRHWPQQDWIFFNEGGGRLLEAAPLGARRSASYTIRLGDLDRDGDIDAVVVRDLLPAQVFLNDGSGAFSHSGDIQDSAAPARSGTLADLNGDGRVNGRDLSRLVLAMLFIPLPAVILDFGLAISLSVSVLILMVALWIPKPLEFNSFPTLLLVVTLLRLSLNVASTRLILGEGHTGPSAAGGGIEGFSRFIVAGNFVIGIVIFAILVVINFVVITKGSTRIAEVAARFSLDAMPGKQMAIDADLGSGLIDEARWG